MTEAQTIKISEEYKEAFGEAIPIFYVKTEDQYLDLHKAAEQAIEKGKALTLKEVHKAIGLVYDPAVDY